MNCLKDYVEWKLAHSDKYAVASGYPLIFENCKANRRMKDLKVYGHNFIRDKRSISRDSAIFKTEGSKVVLSGICSSNVGLNYSASYAVLLRANVKYTFSIHYLSGEFVAGQNGIIIGLRNPSNEWIVAPTRYVSTYRNEYTQTVKVTEDTYVSLSVLGWGEFSDLTFGVQLVEGGSEYGYKEYVGELITDEFDANFNKYKISIVQRGKNLFHTNKFSCSSGAKFLEYGVTPLGNDYAVIKGPVNLNTENQNMASQGWYNTNQGTSKMVLKYGQTVTVSADITALEKHDSRCENYMLIYLMDNARSTTLSSGSRKWYELGVKKRFSETFTINNPNYDNCAWYPVFTLNSHTIRIENIMIEVGAVATEYEPYAEPVHHNIYINSPLSGNEYIDFKEKRVFRTNGVENIECQLPKISSKTTIFETDTTTLPSNMYGKYVKR